MNQADIDAARIKWHCKFELLCIATHNSSLQIGKAIARVK